MREGARAETREGQDKGVQRVWKRGKGGTRQVDKELGRAWRREKETERRGGFRSHEACAWRACACVCVHVYVNVCACV
eukprot:2152701-Pleurochrysis_carterae.AAC.1